MFERFTPEARDVVIRAQEETRALGHAWIGAEHLVLAVLARPAVSGASGLADLGLTYAGWKAAIVTAREPEPGLGTPDEVALQTLGIDLDEVRRRIEAGFGPGALDAGTQPLAASGGRRLPWRKRDAECAAPAAHIPFSPAAKKALERSLRNALDLGDKSIGVEHMLLGILDAKSGPAVDLLAASGTTPDTVRAAVLAARGQAA